MKRSAFTLIELLVVIAIIAVLAGIAMPAFSKAQERARALQDANNLKQLGIGITAFVNDNSDQFFTSSSTPAWPARLLERYVTDRKTFQSPFDKRSPTLDPTTAANVSYGLNTNVMSPQQPKMSNVSNWRSSSALIIGAPNPEGGAQVTFGGVSSDNVVLRTPSGTPAGTHANRKQINVLFGDSHVNQMNWETYADTNSPAGAVRWKP